MYCPKCGTQNDDNAELCISCGNSLKGISSESPQKPITTPNDTNYSNVPITNYDKVPNYLVWSIIVTVLSVLLCNVFALPTGIVAIVFSTQVDSKLRTGDYDGAVKSSKNAKIWCWVTTGLEILSVILGLLLLVLVIVSSVQYGI
jgi:uncharacterized membrane protein YvbJ